MKSPLAVSALALAALLAATPTPAPTPTAPPLPAFSATGTLIAKGTSPDGKKGTLQTQMRVLHRDTRWRIDVTNISATADDPMISAMTQLLPKTAVTVVADPAKKTLTIWSAAKPVYFQTGLEIPKPKPKATAKPTPSPIWQNIMKSLNDMTQYDSFSQSFALVGHQMINGHMASLYHFTSQMQKHGGKLQTANGDIAFADDLSGLPVHLLIDVKAQALANVAIDLTQVSKEAPDASAFLPPANYKRAKSFGELFPSGNSRPNKP